MLERLITISTDYLVKNHVIQIEDRDIYEYGFHSLYNNIIDITSIIIISIWLNMIPQTILYHISFIFLRNSAGGYHAKTHVQCFVISTLVWLLSLWGITHMGIPVICFTLSGFTVILIWLKAPFEHENSPLSKRKYKRMRTLCRILSIIFLSVIVFIYMIADQTHFWLATSLAYGMISYALLALPVVLRLNKHC